MIEKRKFSRWHPVISFKSDVVYAGTRQQVRVLDISAVGMRIFLTRPVDIGTEFSGNLEIPYSLSRFHVEGTVTRIRESGSVWETAVRFDRITTRPCRQDTDCLLN